MSTENLKEQLDEFLQTHYDGSFSRMACDYTHTTGMTQEEVEELLEAMKGVVSRERKKRIFIITNLVEIKRMSTFATPEPPSLFTMLKSGVVFYIYYYDRDIS